MPEKAASAGTIRASLPPSRKRVSSNLTRSSDLIADLIGFCHSRERESCRHRHARALPPFLIVLVVDPFSKVRVQDSVTLSFLRSFIRSEIRLAVTFGLPAIDPI